MGRKPKPISKLCIKCNRVLPLTEFYPHKDWVSQRYHDAWCKECVQKYCVDSKSLAQYCYENDRQWKDSFWDLALKKAQYIAANDSDYISARTSLKKKEEILNSIAARQFQTVMNLKNIYGFVENIDLDGAIAPAKPNSGISGDDEDDDDLRMTYSSMWGGHYTKEQMKTLEEIYSQYEDDFVLDNVNTRDYARKVAKASLNADIAEDKFRRGKISAGEYKEAQKIFDDLSKSANFAACRRKPGETSGLGSLGEIIMRLEVNGALNENGFKFPEDDIDKIVKDFEHTYAACGIEEKL